jgi:hypothetical protein
MAQIFGVAWPGWDDRTVSKLTTYDTIGIGYAAVRKPDPRLAAAIGAALGDATTVVNIGAGTGGYEPSGRNVIAIEPSSMMLSPSGRRARRLLSRPSPKRYPSQTTALMQPWLFTRCSIGPIVGKASTKCAESPVGS